LSESTLDDSAIALAKPITLRYDVLRQGLSGHAAIFDHLGEEMAAGFDGALLGVEVVVHDAEAGDFALGPLEVVDETPVVVALEGQI